MMVETKLWPARVKYTSLALRIDCHTRELNTKRCCVYTVTTSPSHVSTQYHYRISQYNRKRVTLCYACARQICTRQKRKVSSKHSLDLEVSRLESIIRPCCSDCSFRSVHNKYGTLSLSFEIGPVCYIKVGPTSVRNRRLTTQT